MYQLTSKLMDVSRKVRLGGQFSRTLRGLTPAGLISTLVRNSLQHNMERFLMTAEPRHLNRLPRGVRNTPEAHDEENWLY